MASPSLAQSIPMSAVATAAPAPDPDLPGGPTTPWTVEDQLNALYETASTLIAVFETNGNLVFANAAFRRAIATADTPIRNNNLMEFVHIHDHAACQAWLLKSATASSTQPIRIMLVGSGSRQVPVEASATLRSEPGRPPLLHALFFDLSDQERAADAQRQTAELLALLSQHAPCGVFVTDAAGRLRYTNQRWRSQANLLHVNDPRGVWWQMVHPADRDRILAQWHGAQQAAQEFTAEFRVNIADKDPRWIRARIAPSWTKDGRIDCCVGIAEDITLQRQADEVLRRAHEQLEELVQQRTVQLEGANRELNELIYAVTHDLKAPLGGIGRLSEFLAMDYAPKLDSSGTALVAEIQTRVRKLHAIIEGILVYNRVGRTGDSETAVDLNEMVAEITRLLDPPPNVSVIVPEPLPTLTGTPHQIRQVFQNLLDNAIKFSDKTEGRIRILSRREGEAWEFSISDNGPGIPARFHDKIFRLFQRLDLVPNRPGAGVGLAVIKRVIESRGGQIQLASEEGQGTTFRFTWPDSTRRWSP
ncbi:MAG: ATP-binding protein [Limisphaerales bacterium]